MSPNETIYKNLLKRLLNYSEKRTWEPLIAPYVQQMLAVEISQIADSIREQLLQRVQPLMEPVPKGIQGFYFHHFDFIQGGGATTIAAVQMGLNLSEDSTRFEGANREFIEEWGYPLAFRLEFALPYYHYLNDYIRAIPSSGTNEMPPMLREMFEEWDGLTASLDLAHDKGYLALHLALKDWIPTLNSSPNLIFGIVEHHCPSKGTVVYISE